MGNGGELFERFGSTAALPPAAPGYTVPVIESDVILVSVGVTDAVMVAVAASAREPRVQVSVVPDKEQVPDVVVKVVAETPAEVGITGMATVALVLASGPRLVIV